VKIQRTIIYVKRLRQIFTVLLKYGFGNIVERLNIEHNVFAKKILSYKLVNEKRLLNVPDPVKVRKICEELGPTFIKLGQLLSVRPDLVGEDIAGELEKLQDRVPAFSYAEAIKEIVRELGRPVEEAFLNFSHEPIASASLGQVYDARLSTGEEVIVKVLRPEVDGLITSDIEILEELAHLAEKYVEGSRNFNPSGMVHEFKQSIAREMDYTVEARNVERFRTMFKDNENVRIPRVYQDLSSRKILTMEKITGVKVSDTAALKTRIFNPEMVAKIGADAILKQVFEYGFFHADPHPGNFLVSGDHCVVFLDFGMTGRLSGPMKASLADILAGVVNRNIPGIREGFLSLGVSTGAVNTDALDMDLEDIVEDFYDKPLREINVGRKIMDMIIMVSRHSICLPPDIFLLSKALMTIEGVGRQLDPDFNMIEEAAPFLKSFQRQKYSPQKMAAELITFTAALARFTRDLPRDLSAILDKLKHGSLKVEFEHRGLEPLTFHIEKATNRIALSLLIAALVIGSSIIILSNVRPRIAGLSVIGMIGFIVAGLLGVWQIIVIIRSERQ
jgi:ubiquinone biosynthesis protein